jgi:Uma2 family endonuclease
MSTIPRQRGVRPKRWTKDEYYRLGELGFFQGQKVELIEGVLMVQSPQRPQHANAIDVVAELLRGAFGNGYRVRVQMPVDLGQTAEPEPDVLVVQGTRQQYQSSHPTSALLIVEVSDTALSYDRRRKGSLYARAGIQDYWIVNLVNRQVEVYRDPVPDATHHYGHRYDSRADLVPSATVSPLALPGASIAIADLLG